MTKWQMVPDLRRWDVELKCKGYFGFGGGYAKAEGFDYADNGLYCNVCPTQTACWEEHKKRVATITPGLVEEFERRVAEGTYTAETWFAEFHTADPYIMINGGNLEDGLAVSLTGRPKNRGPYTLMWPFTPR